MGLQPWPRGVAAWAAWGCSLGCTRLQVSDPDNPNPNPNPNPNQVGDPDNRAEQQWRMAVENIRAKNLQERDY